MAVDLVQVCQLLQVINCLPNKSCSGGNASGINPFWKRMWLIISRVHKRAQLRVYTVAVMLHRQPTAVQELRVQCIKQHLSICQQCLLPLLLLLLSLFLQWSLHLHADLGFEDLQLQPPRALCLEGRGVAGSGGHLLQSLSHPPQLPRDHGSEAHPTGLLL